MMRHYFIEQTNTCMASLCGYRCKIHSQIFKGIVCNLVYISCVVIFVLYTFLSGFCEVFIFILNLFYLIKKNFKKEKRKMEKKKKKRGNN